MEDKKKKVGDSDEEEAFERFTINVEEDRLVGKSGSALVLGVAWVPERLLLQQRLY